ncbi:MAG: replication-relaxation family protein [Acidobacteria bacterium]|nr:replication-relaxation family protein [Acidobacteriota bacterium]
MRVTARDRQVLARLATARWLTTSQVKKLCFSKVTVDMARRRLRLLRKAGYVISLQTNQMTERIQTLGRKGKELLIEHGWRRGIKLERVPPRNWAHFCGINDLRVGIERNAQSAGMTLGFFYAHWELQQLGWTYPIVPDAVCQLQRADRSMTIVFEYDRGEEAPEYVARTKFARYSQGLDGFPVSRVVVVVETQKRLEQLRRYVAHCAKPDRFVFTLRDGLIDIETLSRWLT